jgi:DNA transformation protein and related proteins
MTTSRDFADYCCELLSSLGPCVAKRMFGGFGISIEGMSVAIIADLGDGEKLWLKADDETRARYEAAGCERFTYEMTNRQGIKEPKSMNYYSAPEDAMDSREAMRAWAELALECALRARVSQHSKKKRPLAHMESALPAIKNIANEAMAPVKAPAKRRASTSKAAVAKRSSRRC